MIKLIFIPKPLPEESPSSILRRLANRHGLITNGSLHYLGMFPDPRGSILYRNRRKIQRIAQSISCPEDRDAFLNGFYLPLSALAKKPKVLLFGVTVPADFFRTSEPAYCSECWKNKHEYFIKDLKFALYCPYHSRKYLKTCPNCGSTLAWHQLLDNHCDCPELPESELCDPEVVSFERRALELFRSGNAKTIQEFLTNLRLLGYRGTDDSYCPANRITNLLALALAENDEDRVLEQLLQLSKIYPEIPKRIICIKLELFRSPSAKGAIRSFLASSQTAVAKQEFESLDLKTPFRITPPQLVRWLSIKIHEKNLLREHPELSPTNARYNLEQVQKIEETLATIRKNSESKKKSNNHYTEKYLQEILFLSRACIREAISEEILKPIIDPCRQRLFSDSDIERFTNKYISIKLFSAQSNISIKYIRRVILRFPKLGTFLNNPLLHLHVISLELRDAVVIWYNRGHRTLRSKVHYKLPHLTGKEQGTWLSAEESAAALHLCVSIVKTLIQKNLIKCGFRLKESTGYAISMADIEEYRKNYISVTEASPLIRCNISRTTKILKDANILPVTGPTVDNSNTYIFVREEVNKYASRTINSELENQNNYTMEDAKRKLNLSIHTIHMLIKRGTLTTSAPIETNGKFINQLNVNNFYESHIKTSTIAKLLNIPTICVYRELIDSGVLPIAGNPRYATKDCIYELSSITNLYPTIGSLRNDSKKSKKCHLIKYSTLARKYGISTHQFSRLFLSTGFVEYLPGPSSAPRAAYLTKENAQKTAKILDKYLTISQADKYLGHLSLAFNLIRTHRIEPCYPLRPYSNRIMIKRKDLYKYVKSKIIT